MMPIKALEAFTNCLPCPTNISDQKSLYLREAFRRDASAIEKKICTISAQTGFYCLRSDKCLATRRKENSRARKSAQSLEKFPINHSRFGSCGVMLEAWKIDSPFWDGVNNRLKCHVTR